MLLLTSTLKNIPASNFDMAAVSFPQGNHMNWNVEKARIKGSFQKRPGYENPVHVFYVILSAYGCQSTREIMNPVPRK